MYPLCAFTHLDEDFDPSKQVPADHPMVAARPDLFTPSKPKATKAATPTDTPTEKE